MSTTVSGEGYKKLLEECPQKIKKIEKTLVENMGKTDDLGKVIVCGQGIWMLIQCITRKAGGLPVTLLELHVAMHVVCALIMYLLWWNKPQSITEPLTLVEDHDNAGVLVLQSQGLVLQWVYREGGESLGGEAGDAPSLRQEKRQSSTVLAHIGLNTPIELTDHVGVYFHSDSSKLNWAPNADYITIDARECLLISKVLMVYYYGTDMSPLLGGSELNALFRLSELYPRTEERFLELPIVDVVAGRQPGEVFGKILDNAADILNGWRSCSLAISILLVYGGCHAAAWNTHFPSPIECWMWRVSSIVIRVIPSYIVLLYQYPQNFRGEKARVGKIID